MASLVETHTHTHTVKQLVKLCSLRKAEDTVEELLKKKNVQLVKASEKSSALKKKKERHIGLHVCTEKGKSLGLLYLFLFFFFLE